MRPLNGSSAFKISHPSDPIASAKRAFFISNRFARFHEFDVSNSDIGDDPSIRLRNLRQRADLTGMIHSEFPNTDFILGCCLQNCSRKTDVVVEIALRLGDVEFFPRAPLRQSPWCWSCRCFR